MLIKKQGNKKTLPGHSSDPVIEPMPGDVIISLVKPGVANQKYFIPAHHNTIPILA